MSEGGWLGLVCGLCAECVGGDIKLDVVEVFGFTFWEECIRSAGIVGKAVLVIAVKGGEGRCGKWVETFSGFVF